MLATVFLAAQRREVYEDLQPEEGPLPAPLPTSRDASFRTHIQIVHELWVARVPRGDGREFEIHDYLAKMTGGTLTPGDDAEDVRWVSPEELRQLSLTTGLADYLDQAGLIPQI